MSGDEFWALDPTIDFLNHGSFGACPRPVLDIQQRLREEMEQDPVRFFRERYPEFLDVSRRRLAAFLNANPEDLVFVANATEGVSTVLRSLPLGPGDEVLATDHEYGACLKALDHLAARRGFRPVRVRIPLPVVDPEEVTTRIVEATTERTKLALVSHVTSPTALVFPIDAIVRRLEARGIDVLVDGAHAAGQCSVDLSALQPAYYTGNAHKWLCAPKGAAYLVVRRDRQAEIEPLVLSHYIEADRDRFRLSFDWTGTRDPTAVFAIPAALDVLEERFGEGLGELMAANRSLALAARRVLMDHLETDAPAPESMVGSMAAVRLPDDDRTANRTGEPPTPGAFASPTPTPLERALARERLQVPISIWPGPPARWLRVSAQAYNHLEQYHRLAHVVRTELGESTDV